MASLGSRKSGIPTEWEIGPRLFIPDATDGRTFCLEKGFDLWVVAKAAVGIVVPIISV
jgi:hypothetical protein